MFYILYTNKADINIWETADDENDVRQTIRYLTTNLGIDAANIAVFRKDGKTLTETDAGQYV